MDAGLFGQGVVIGLMAAVPIGPVNIEIIRRGLTRGFRPALALGLGAVSVDAVYLTLVLAGVVQWVRAEWLQRLMLAGGGVFLLALGVLAVRSARRVFEPGWLEQARGATGGGLGSVGRSYLVGLGLTASSPYTIAYWVSVSVQLAGRAFDWADYSASLAGVFSATLSWVLFISGLCALGRRWVGPRLFGLFNLLGAALLGAFGVYFLVSALWWSRAGTGL